MFDVSSACTQALEALNKKDLTEIRSYGKPPELVERVMDAVMILRNSPTGWQEAKRQLSKPLSVHVSYMTFDHHRLSAVLSIAMLYENVMSQSSVHVYHLCFELAVASAFISMMAYTAISHWKAKLLAAACFL